MNMNTQQLIIAIVVGIVAGWLGSLVVGGPSSLIGYLVTGIIGAFVGSFVFGAAGWRVNLGNELVDSIVISAVGAIIVIIIAKLIVFA
jgi:uncharacterized membrane protein YeaQ/YmgE (transglycosylase-associated protein family)